MSLHPCLAIVICAATLQFATAQSNTNNNNNNKQRRGSCSSVNCGANTECLEIGNEGVCQCLPGFVSTTGSQRDCTDRNECRLMPCGTFSTCRNTVGSYTCRCFGGYVSDTNNGENCRPSNPSLNCNFGHTCGSHSRCARTSISSRAHRCYCEKGYYVSSQRNCPDRNECTVLPNNGACSSNSRCENTQGSYRCICREGFEKDNSGRCTDVDECNSRGCGANSACLNKYGSYTCSCFRGYMSRGGRQGQNCVVDPNADPSTRTGPRSGQVGGAGRQGEGCHTATVIAAVTCAIVGVLIIVAIIYFLIKQRKRSQRRKFSQGKGTFAR